MKTVVFDTVNTAAYSPRPNTPAATMKEQIPEDVKKERLQRINELNKEHAAQRRARLLGKQVEVLVEERNVRVPTQVTGRTRHGYIVYFEGDIDELRGRVVTVEIDARPSDAIAIGLRFESPIFTFEAILAEAGIVLTDETEDDITELKSELKSTEKKTKPKAAEDLKNLTVDKLNELLNDAIEKEDYERAAKIRDELSRRN